MPNAFTAKALIRILIKHHQFSVIRQKGSHVFLKHSDGRTTVIPHHSGKTLGTGLLLSILKDLHLKKDDLKK